MVQVAQRILLTVVVSAAAQSAGCGDEFQPQDPETSTGPGVGAGASMGTGGSGTDNGGAGGTGGAGATTGSGGAGGCPIGTDDCDGDGSCETDTASSNANCGQCGTVCTTQCVASVCDDAVWLSAGARSTCVVRGGGDVYCWGSNERGVLGDGGTEDSNLPVKVPLPGPAASVSVARMAGHDFACAVLVSKDLYCWGENNYGQLGIGPAGAGLHLPTAVSLANVEAVTCGLAHACALTGDGDVYCWGSNQDAELGNGSGVGSDSPVFVLSGASQVSSGQSHVCAVMAAGGVTCWGLNDEGQAGMAPSAEPVEAPTAVAGTQAALAVSVDRDTSCALDGNGTVSCWGGSIVFELCTDAPAGFDEPTALPVSPVSLFDTSYGATFLGVSGEPLRVCGNSTFGKLGLGASPLAKTPAAIAGTIGMKQVSGGNYHACALHESGRLYCWGQNILGQVGIGTNDNVTTPVEVTLP